jgi:hypothetical protein
MKKPLRKIIRSEWILKLHLECGHITYRKGSQKPKNKAQCEWCQPKKLPKEEKQFRCSCGAIFNTMEEFDEHIFNEELDRLAEESNKRVMSG